MQNYVHFTLGETMKFICPITQEKGYEYQCRKFLADNSFPIMGKAIHNIRSLTESEELALERAVVETSSFWNAQNQVCYRSEEQYLEMLDSFLHEKQIDLMGIPTMEKPIHQSNRRQR